MQRRYLLALLIMLMSWGASLWAQVPVPEYKHRVTDLTGTLTPDQRSLLEQKLADIEYQKDSLLALLIVPSTGGEAIATYGARVYQQWHIKRPSLEHGIILVIAKNDRQIQIVPAPTLETAIAGNEAERIIQGEIAPHFRQGNYYSGVLAGVSSLSSHLKKPPSPQEAASAAQALAKAAEAGKISPWFLLLALFVAGAARQQLGALPGATLAALVCAMSVGLISHAAWAAILVGLPCFFLAIGYPWCSWGPAFRFHTSRRVVPMDNTLYAGTSGEW